MSLKKNGYMSRLIDKKISEYLEIFGAINIEGPKWCGKTWSALNSSNSAVFLDREEVQKKAELSLDLVLNDEKPQLLDEWNLIPKIWDSVRRKCDDTVQKGNYILTCSTKLTDVMQKQSIYHSGAGRIGNLNMYTMSLYESEESTGKVSIMNMKNGIFENSLNSKVELENLANLIVRGGWPSNLKTPSEKSHIIPRSYIETILTKDIHQDKKRDKSKMNTLLKSLARNESTVVNKMTLLKDISSYYQDNDNIDSRTTLDDYIDVLERLHIIKNQTPYNTNYRSTERIGKTSKRHFIDPSLACACLNITSKILLDDIKTFGFMFEALVERDLQIYMEYLDGKLYHFRDNVSGLEVDSILEFNDGEYAAVEIKLGLNQIEDAKKSLLKFYDNMSKKPAFMCIIVGYTDVIAKDPETGIYIFPLTALKP